MTTTLASRVDTVKQQILAAAHKVGRNPAEIRVLAVSKTQNSALINELSCLGQRDFGENYIQEALRKQQELVLHAGMPMVQWHCIGPVQSNKSRLVAEHFDWCHSVDSEKLARRLHEQRPAHRPPLNVCLQLHVGEETSKSGVTADVLLALAHAIRLFDRLRLRGIMCIPPPAESYEEQRFWFAQTRQVYQTLQQQFDGIDTLSMGMSADLEAAIAEGSTMVRVGTAIFGARPKPSSAKT